MYLFKGKLAILLIICMCAIVSTVVHYKEISKAKLIICIMVLFVMIKQLSDIKQLANFSIAQKIYAEK